jgi:Na+/proline symporter
MAIIYMLLYMGMALYAPVVALSFMTGFPQWAAILVAGSICTIYTSFVSQNVFLFDDSCKSISRYIH